MAPHFSSWDLWNSFQRFSYVDLMGIRNSPWVYIENSNLFTHCFWDHKCGVALFKKHWNRFVNRIYLFMFNGFQTKWIEYHTSSFLCFYALSFRRNWRRNEPVVFFLEQCIWLYTDRMEKGVQFCSNLFFDWTSWSVSEQCVIRVPILARRLLVGAANYIKK